MEEKKSIHCTLTDTELAAKADQWIDELIASGGKSFMMRVPARPNADTDLIFAELNNRFKRLIGQQSAVWVKASAKPPVCEPVCFAKIKDNLIDGDIRRVVLCKGATPDWFMAFGIDLRISVRIDQVAEWFDESGQSKEGNKEREVAFAEWASWEWRRVEGKNLWENQKTLEVLKSNDLYERFEKETRK